MLVHAVRMTGTNGRRGMSVGFKCPSCAGDLTAKPGEKTTECPFCGISVLVPDELLDRRQIWPAEVIEAGRIARRAGRIVSVILGVLAVVAAAVFLISSLGSNG